MNREARRKAGLEDAPRSELEIAWASGFFDGEGSTLAHRTTNRHTPNNGWCKWYLRVQVCQTDLGPLERFKAAFGNVGSIDRGRPNGGLGNKIIYQYTASGKEAERIFFLMEPYLCQPKKDQGFMALDTVFFENE